MRQTRSSMLDALDTDYVRTARAKGLREGRVVWVHGLRNSLIVVVTIVGLQLGALISGAVVTERIFSLPGFGKLTIDAVFQRDYPVIQAVVLITATAYIVINLLVDLLYSLIDPRIRVVRGGFVTVADTMPAAEPPGALLRPPRTGQPAAAAPPAGPPAVAQPAGHDRAGRADHRGARRDARAPHRAVPARPGALRRVVHPAGQRRLPARAPTRWAATSSRASCTAPGRRCWSACCPSCSRSRWGCRWGCWPATSAVSTRSCRG